MNDPDTHAAARQAFEDLLYLRRPVQDVAKALVPYLNRAHQGPPLVTMTREAICGAIRAYQAGALSGPELRAWAILVHGEIGSVVGRSPSIGLERASRLRLHDALDRLIETGPYDYTEEGLEPTMQVLNTARTDIGWLARLPGVNALTDMAATALWALVIVPVLTAPRLPDTASAVAVGSLGGYAVIIAITRWRDGPESAIDCFQTFLPFALLGLAMVGVAYTLGGNG